jgi:ABC-type protease/lipase transport system fused ATPase/permease subunit
VQKVLLLRDGAVEAYGPRDDVMKRLVKPAEIARVTDFTAREA